MNAIIVGVNGRPSIIDMLKSYKFKSQICIFAQYHKRDGKEFWKKIELLDDGFIGFSMFDGIPSFGKGDRVIFWGSRAVLNTTGALVYNEPKVLANASKKGLARKILNDNGIHTPKTVFRAQDAMRELRFPIIIRPESHRAGKNFYVAKNNNEIIKYFNKVENGYLSEFYPKTKEFRVHVASGKALLVKQKPEPDDKTTIAWNFAQNEKPWTTINRKDYDFDMIMLALKAIDAIKLDFGAVDIMSYPISKDLPKHVVAEVNTAPSYTPYLIEKYGAYFDLIFSQKEDTKLKKWEYSKFKKGKSFSWKNYQLKGDKSHE